MLEIVSNLFSTFWRLFTDVTVPGFSFSFADLMIAIVLIRLSVSIIRHVFGVGGGTSYRGSSARSPRISDARKEDEY